MRYRRATTPGESYFFTVNLDDRKSQLLVEFVDVLKASIKHVKSAHPFEIEALVVMPYHLHTIWTLPENDNDFSSRWGID